MQKIHFLGIGGSGASAVAAIAQANGYEVTGCDKDLESEFLTPFSKKQLFLGHNPNHLIYHSEQSDKFVDMLVVTPAVFSLDPDNKELLRAKENNIPVITWQEFLGKFLAKDKFVIAIAGTHGKSTTTAMCAQILEDAGMDPTVVLGAIVPKWGSNYRVGHSKYLVIEADEFNDNFLNYTPDIAIVTNIEMDHPEYFKDLDAVKASFNKFLSISQKVIREAELIDFPLQIPGDYNISNASLAYQLGLELKINPEIVKQSLEGFTGIARRFEKIGEYHGAMVYSDFGHHPTEIKVTIQAAREKFPDKKLWVIFQPHMFSRTKGLFDDFVKVFQELPADEIIITDIYPSREVDTGLVNSQELVDAINESIPKSCNGVKMVLNEQILDKIRSEVREGDILFFMGAGDTDKWAKELVFG